MFRCEEKVDGLICLGYPLCAMGDRSKLRDEVLRALTTPVLFVQGTRDKLCPLDLLAHVRGEMKARSELHLVQGGDHSLGVGKRQLQAAGEMQEDVDRRILAAIAEFVSSLPAKAGLSLAVERLAVNVPDGNGSRTNQRRSIARASRRIAEVSLTCRRFNHV